MILAKVHRNQDDEDGVLVQLMTTPRIGETITIDDVDGVERDLRVTGVNHWCKSIEALDGQSIQVQIVVFCALATTIS